VLVERISTIFLLLFLLLFKGIFRSSIPWGLEWGRLKGQKKKVHPSSDGDIKKGKGVSWTTSRKTREEEKDGEDKPGKGKPRPIFGLTRKPHQRRSDGQARKKKWFERLIVWSGKGKKKKNGKQISVERKAGGGRGGESYFLHSDKGKKAQILRRISKRQK